MKEPINKTEMTKIAMTNGVPHPSETPSDKAISRRSAPDVNRNAPIQSTPEARGVVVSEGSRLWSFGMTKMAETPAINEAPAITKRTTFQLVY